MEILQTPSFNRQVRKPHKNQRKEIEKAIRNIVTDPTLGKAKIGDLNGVYVYKFKMLNQLNLLAYQFDTSQLVLVALGSHENFTEI